MTIARRVTYSGRVQGVGFRYTTQGVARRFPVVGYVRNRSDGRVELVAEGDVAAVDGFLAAVASVLAGNIDQTDALDVPPVGHVGFTIRP